MRKWVVLLGCVLLACGCDRSSPSGSPQQPEAVWLETGLGPGQVVYPRAITFDKENNCFYVVDRQARIQRFDSSGKYLSGWSMPEYMAGKPVGISIGPGGLVYVPDTHYHRVIVYRPDGTEVRRWGKQGSGPGEFIYPTDIAFDAAGNVYVGEYGDHDRIQVFTQEGTYLREFGAFGQGPGQFSRPQSLVITGNTLFLTDACNHRIMVFKTDGTFVRSFSDIGSEPGKVRFPYGLDIDSAGNLLVTEFGNNRIQKFSPDGQSLGTWGTGGRLPGELAFPWAAVFDNDGRIIIVDSGNNRLQVVRLHP